MTVFFENLPTDLWVELSHYLSPSKINNLIKKTSLPEKKKENIKYNVSSYYISNYLLDDSQANRLQSQSNQLLDDSQTIRLQRNQLLDYPYVLELESYWNTQFQKNKINRMNLSQNIYDIMNYSQYGKEYIPLFEIAVKNGFMELLKLLFFTEEHLGFYILHEASYYPKIFELLLRYHPSAEEWNQEMLMDAILSENYQSDKIVALLLKYGNINPSKNDNYYLKKAIKIYHKSSEHLIHEKKNIIKLLFNNKKVKSIITLKIKKEVEQILK